MRCVLYDCKSRFEKGKKLSFFKPLTDDILMAWSKVICCKEELLNKTDTVCEVHFNESDIEKEYITRMSDSTIARLPRGQANLREGAVPSLTENHLPTKRRKHPQGTKNCKPLDNEKLLSKTDYNTVVNNFNAIQLPFLFWFANAFPECIVWNCWSEEEHSSKRVLLRSNLTV